MSLRLEIAIDDPSADRNEANSEWLLVNYKTILGIVGAAAFFAWLFFACATNILVPAFLDDDAAMVQVHLPFVLGIVCALVFSALQADFLSAHRLVYYSASLLLVCAGLVCGLILGNALWIGFLMSGLGGGFLYVLYGEYLSLFLYSAIEPYVCGIFTTAAIFSIVVLLIDPQYQLVFVSGFAGIAYIGYGSQMVFYDIHRYPSIGKEESRRKCQIVFRSYLSTTTSGMVLGYALGCLLATQSAQPFSFAIMVGTLIVVFALLTFDALKLKKVGETLSMRLFLPLVAIFAFPLIFVSDQWKFIFALFLLCGSLVPTTMSITALCTHIAICNLAAIREFAIGRFASLIGIVFGMLLAMLGFSHYVDFLFSPYNLLVSVCIFVLLIIFSASFVMTEDNYPRKSKIHTAAGNDDSVSVDSGTPIKKIESNDRGSGEPEPTQEFVRHPGMFHQKCEIVARKYGLSRRQAEVLAMLAKGRNAEYITEKLVISPHTAKAHIYNIYLKLDVHSRQELMDLVENTVMEKR